ncbi:MAG: hypothetical protein AB7K37_12965 [Cyclobacteriaceae bacterium]
MRYVFTFFLSTMAVLGWAQSTNAPLNDDYYHWIDRYEIKAGRVMPQIFTSVKPYKRAALVGYLDSLDQAGIFASSQDQSNLAYLRNDNWEWSRPTTNESEKPILTHFYKKKSDLLYSDLPEFDIHVNPVLYLGYGYDQDLKEDLYVNTRGVEIRGMIDRKIGFYTFLSENQARLPSYVRTELPFNPVVPHEGFWKGFKKNAVDFFQARAYVDFNLTRNIYMQFGHDKTFIGNGYRSLIFSDFAPPALFLRGNVKVWKINYLWQLNRVAADVSGSAGGSGGGGGRRYPEKFIAFHHASLNIGKKLNVGVFESVVFSPKDTVNGNAFDLSYLNPVIFYRAIEQQFGSSDNVILGADFKYNAFRNISFYGQVVIDEFLLANVRSGDGWWANKFGFQGGIKYIDVAGISNLDLQLEANTVRPYTYSHGTQYGSYSNYRQPMAHPFGANFTELIGIVRYQPLPQLNLTFKGIQATAGRDTLGVNWGGDILKNNSSRESDFGNTTGQGISQTVRYLDFTASYMLRHNLFVDVKQVVRTGSSDVGRYQSNTSITSVALRWNMAQRYYDF